MSVKPTTTRGPAADGELRCEAPSCWEGGTRIEIDGDDVANPPVLCDTHRRAYLGVST